MLAASFADPSIFNYIYPMDNSLLVQNDLIKKEADEILTGKRLLSILNLFGTPHISGSYALNLMTWRDLDIYLEVENISKSDFFILGKKIEAIFNPIKMSFRNEIIGKTKGLPNGLYWGIYLGNERLGAWKIDIWAVKSFECKRLLNYCTTIQKKLTPENSFQILNIKSRCWQDPEYRRSYTSLDIYTAVLEKNITTFGAFKKYLKTIL